MYLCTYIKAPFDCQLQGGGKCATYSYGPYGSLAGYVVVVKKLDEMSVDKKSVDELIQRRAGAG
jgi:hypothetical protein